MRKFQWENAEKARLKKRWEEVHRRCDTLSEYSKHVHPAARSEGPFTQFWNRKYMQFFHRTFFTEHARCKVVLGVDLFGLYQLVATTISVRTLLLQWIISANTPVPAVRSQVNKFILLAKLANMYLLRLWTLSSSSCVEGVQACIRCSSTSFLYHLQGVTRVPPPDHARYYIVFSVTYDLGPGR